MEHSHQGLIMHEPRLELLRFREVNRSICDFCAVTVKRES